MTKTEEIVKLKKFLVILFSTCDCDVHKKLPKKQKEYLDQILLDVSVIMSKERRKKRKNESVR